MKTLAFKTNIHCGKCIAKISPVLNEESTIEQWQVDTAHAAKILTVTGSADAPAVAALMAKAGFTAEEVAPEHVLHTPATQPVACSMEDKTKENSSAPSFWTDGDAWKRAASNTFTCLIGCSIGDFGTIIFLQRYYHHELSMFAMMGIAMVMGLLTSILLETVILRIKENFSFAEALRTAFSMSFLSMLAMEFTENATDFLLTGGMVAQSDPFYWFALAVSLLMGFLVPLPYNYYQLKKFNKACH